MKAQQAIGIFGRHWLVDVSNNVVERLREADHQRARFEFDDLDTAVAAALAARKLAAQTKIENDRAILTTPRNRVLIGLARVHLGNWQTILGSVAKINARIAAEQALINQIDAGDIQPEIECLADDLKAPIVLPVGTPVWEVDWAWPLLSDLKITEMCVREIRVYDSCRGNFDFDPTYTISPKKGEGRARSFQYLVPEEDENPPMQLECNVSGVSYFLSLKAALAHASQLARQVRESAATIDELVAATAGGIALQDP